MILDNIRVLFRFINYLHSKMDLFNESKDIIIDWKKLCWDKDQLGNHYKDILKKRKIEDVIEEKKRLITINITLDISFEAFYYNFSIDKPEKIYFEYNHDVLSLIKYFDENNLPEILEAKRQYIELRNELNSNIISLTELWMVFVNLDLVMSNIIRTFWEEGDKSIPKIELTPFDQSSILTENPQCALESSCCDTVLNIYNEDKAIDNDIMDIDYTGIFNNALRYADDPEEMKAYCIREQKRAEAKSYFTDESFYKGLLKVVPIEKQYFKNDFDHTVNYFKNRVAYLENSLSNVVTNRNKNTQTDNVNEDKEFLEYYKKEIELRNKFGIYRHKIAKLTYRKYELLEQTLTDLLNKAITQTDIKLFLDEEKENNEINAKEIEQPKQQKSKRKPGRPLSTHNEAVFYLHNEKLLPFLIDNYSNVKPQVFNQLVKVLIDLQQLKEAEIIEYKEAFGEALNIKQSHNNYYKAIANAPNPKLFDTIKAKIQANIKTE